METKSCTKCNQTKPVDQFVRNNLKRPGSWCRECYRSYRKERGYDRYSERSEYFTKWHKEYRKTDKNIEYEKEFRTPYRRSLTGTISDIFSSAKHRAKTKKWEFDLDVEWVREKLLPMKCEATDIDLILENDENYCHSPFRPSIDRIDSKKGYTKDNCRIVSVIFNKAKSDYTDEIVAKMAEAFLRKLGNDN